MRLSKEDFRYLTGEDFSSGYKMSLSKNTVKPRLETLTDLVRGKSVIHVGCADHLNLIEKKIKENGYLHKILEDNCKEVIGFDISEEAVNLMKQLGFKNVYVHNVLEDENSLILDKKYDFMILGEIVEHLDNPVSFLTKLRENYKGNVNEIIITVPNAFSWVGRKYMKMSIEAINSDHRFWFTPFTIAKVCVMSEFKPSQILFANNRFSFSNRITNKFRKILKMNIKYSENKCFESETIITIANFN